MSSSAKKNKQNSSKQIPSPKIITKKPTHFRAISQNLFKKPTNEKNFQKLLKNKKSDDDLHIKILDLLKEKDGAEFFKIEINQQKTQLSERHREKNLIKDKFGQKNNNNNNKTNEKTRVNSLKILHLMDLLYVDLGQTFEKFSHTVQNIQNMNRRLLKLEVKKIGEHFGHVHIEQ